MALSAGDRLGPYEILAPLGAGGMGEVYRARDTRLDRTVALKVLPEHVGGDPERRERFEREARAISSLNHPHICTVHDVGRQDGIDFLVMELIEGETLADRLAKGALPLDQALRCGIQIADALAQAHRGGVVHRDLKPGNVILTRSRVKLLDFGLAKLQGPGTDAVEKEAPTVQKPLTTDGTLLGTMQYMAPEQLEGKEADARSDIFAFGAVLHEMVTGRRAFEGKGQASLIAAIMEHEPPSIAELRPVIPPELTRLVGTCLAKDPDERWQSAADVKRELEWIAGGGGDTQRASTTGAGSAWTHAPTGPWSSWRRALAAGALIALMAGAAAWVGKPGGDGTTERTTRLVVALPPDHELLSARSPSIALSPDGRYLVYAARSGETSQLYVRPLDRFESTPISGTEGGRSPFFSPDGEWVAFFTADRLKKVPREGGSPVTICETLEEGHGSWGRDGQIVFGYGRARISGLWQVPAAGGTPFALTSPDMFTEDEWGHGAPHILPSQQTILFSGRTPSGPRLRALSRADSVVHDLQLGGTGGGSPRWASTGHLVYSGAGGRLAAVRFDAARLETRGVARPLAERTAIDMVLGIAQFALSDNGTLAYIPGQSRNQLLWVDRKGVTTPVDSRLDVHLTPRLSPDGRNLAVAVFDEGVARRSLWVLDLERGARMRLTFTDGQATDPVWLGDDRLAYGFAPEGGALGVFSRSADGSGEAVEMFAPGLQTMPSSVSNDGRLLVFYQAGLTGADLGVIHLDEDREPTMLTTTPHEQIQPALSPDGRWLAYTSNETGRREVYVTSFPDLEGKWQISSGGGYEVLWAPRRQELYYRTDDAVKVVSYTTRPDFAPSTPSVLFEGTWAVDPFSADAHNWTISPDGERFLMISQEAPQQINVVLNWFEELERLVPTD